jgi:NADPH-dependent curcumin reductase CurA
MPVRQGHAATSNAAVTVGPIPPKEQPKMRRVNHQVRLATRPVGEPQPTDWAHIDEAIGEPGDGEFLVRVLYLSIDPAMRGWMNAGRSYIRPVEIGEVMRAGAVGQVVASRHSGFAVGDHSFESCMQRVCGA